MPKNRGKEFESKVKEDFLKLPYSHIERVYDNTSGYKSIKGRADFIAYLYPNMYYLECKCHYGNTFPLSNLTQYEGLLEVTRVPGIRAGVVLWMMDHDKVIYIPVRTVQNMKENGEKSYNIVKHGFNKYRVFEIPSVKKRVFMDSDYNVLRNLEDGD